MVWALLGSAVKGAVELMRGSRDFEPVSVTEASEAAVAAPRASVGRVAAACLASACAAAALTRVGTSHAGAAVEPATAEGEVIEKAGELPAWMNDGGDGQSTTMSLDALLGRGRYSPSPAASSPSVQRSVGVESRATGAGAATASSRPAITGAASTDIVRAGAGDREKFSIDTSAVPKATSNSDMYAGSMGLYCFSLMLPDSYEVDLIKAQYYRGASIFACEGWDVFSTTEQDLNEGGQGPLLRTKSIGSMECAVGGPWDLALNTDIFLKAWRLVFGEGRYVNFGWTVKADPDCVWFPSRFKTQVRYLDADLEFYLNNCDQGLHGPIEVIPRGGMKRFAAGLHSCENDRQLVTEKTTWGEDVFLRHCLHYLGVSKINDYNLLSEKACFDEHPETEGCWSGKVGFHPFKDTEKYFKCIGEADLSKARTTFTQKLHESHSLRGATTEE